MAFTDIFLWLVTIYLNILPVAAFDTGDGLALLLGLVLGEFGVRTQFSLVIGLRVQCL